jgi:DAK2 domain fusion protein YloV
MRESSLDASTRPRYRPILAHLTRRLSAESSPGGLVDGPRLRDAFAAAAAHLRDVRFAIDAINVYPVPDGDTGSNMSATLSEAYASTDGLASPSVATVLNSLARGALYGARGNSGVILSQALRGFAGGVGDPAELDAAALAEGLRRAAEAAYSAVAKPQEGTMLTVLRIAGETAADHIVGMHNAGRGQYCLPLLDRVITAAEEAEAATMLQLPALAEAGVPDAGGEGICAVLRGLKGGLTGVSPAVLAAPPPPVSMTAGHAGDASGFCTEFLVEQVESPISLEALRELAAAGGNTSVVVVGDASLARVHAHSATPQALLDVAAEMGRLSRIKVEDMAAQNVRYRAAGTGAGAKSALLALSPSAGFDSVFAGMGAHVTELGVITKPPAGQIAAAADALQTADVIVLPNHRNVILAAEQAVGLAHCTIHIVPTLNLSQGIAAALAFEPSTRAAENIERMKAATTSVRSVEITIAAADRSADGVAVRKGEAITLLDGRLVSSASTAEVALIEGLRRADAAAAGLVTVYLGEGAAPKGDPGLLKDILGEFPGVECEMVETGQPLYPYIAAVE